MNVSTAQAEGVHSPLFDEAIAWAQAHESAWPRDPDDPRGTWGVHVNDPPPWNRLLGPVHSRGPASGVVWRAGQVLALVQAQGFTIIDVTTREADLEDVFVALTSSASNTESADA